MAKTEDKDKMHKAEELALQIWKLARDNIMVQLRFLDAAVGHLTFQAQFGLEGISCDGSTIFYDPVFVVLRYKKEPNLITRSYLHVLMHCIFNHAFSYNRVEQNLWDIACDMAAENAILELRLSGMDISRDKARYEELRQWRQKTSIVTAERIYKVLRDTPLYAEDLNSLAILFGKDNHIRWQETSQLEITQAQWQKISERIKAQLKSFSQDKTDKNSIVQNLEEASREHYDYGDFLKRFCTSGEDVQINDDEFDYVYYTYGLKLYGNLPLVEPLEYKDVNKIKEFVVAIDTSASCRGKLVQAFLKKTYDILKSSENFFRKVNIHIIQCDSRIQSDTKITCDEDFEAFMKTGKLEGFGSTDFRPVFTYVQECIDRKEFDNLKGLIYFTDGYGTFPVKMPAYDTAFVFLNDDYQQPQIPPWAIKLVLSEEELEEEEGSDR